MNPPRLNPTGRLAVVLAVLLGLAPAAAGCSSPSDSAPPPTTAPTTGQPYPPPRPDSVDGPTPTAAAPAPPATASPDAVARAGLKVMFTWYTSRDTGPAAATRRALAYLAPPMSTDVTAAPPVASPGAQWATWAAHKAVLSPTITPGGDDTPPATPTRAYRQYQVTQTVRGTAGWTAPPVATTAFVTLTRTTAGWRITEVIQR